MDTYSYVPEEIASVQRWQLTHCSECERAFGPDVIEKIDTDAAFWLGQYRDRYCRECLDSLAEVQDRERFEASFDGSGAFVPLGAR